ncbi:unnamed protein product, partial [Nesidiocoris tenuis]
MENSRPSVPEKEGNGVKSTARRCARGFSDSSCPLNKALQSMHGNTRGAIYYNNNSGRKSVISSKILLQYIIEPEEDFFFGKSIRTS